MRNKKFNRRDFLRITAICCAMPYLATKLTGKKKNNSYSQKLNNDSDFVIIDGWVLLKSDLGIS